MVPEGARLKHRNSAYMNFSTIGGGDSTIPSPGLSPEQPLQGTGPRDPLRCGQGWSESNFFRKGVGQKCPRERIFSSVPSQNGENKSNIPLPHSLNASNDDTSSLDQVCCREGSHRSAFRPLALPMFPSDGAGSSVRPRGTSTGT